MFNNFKIYVNRDIDKGRERLLRAFKAFSPKILIKHLKKSADGTILVDKSALVISQDDELNFYCVLDRDYISGFKNMSQLTVFFETDGTDIWGGAYNMITNEKVSKRRIISQDTSTPYTYTTEALNEFKTMLLNIE